MQDGLQESRDHFCNNKSSHASSNSPTPGGDARVIVWSRQHASARQSVILPQYGEMPRKCTMTASGMLAVMKTGVHHSLRLYWQSKSAEEAGAMTRMK